MGNVTLIIQGLFAFTFFLPAICLLSTDPMLKALPGNAPNCGAAVCPNGAVKAGCPKEAIGAVDCPKTGEVMLKGVDSCGPIAPALVLSEDAPKPVNEEADPVL